MRTTGLKGACLVFASLALSGVTPVHAVDYPWCALGSSIGRQCSYTTPQQCQAAISGVGGSCMQNPAMTQQASQRPSPSDRSERSKSRPPPGVKIHRAPGKHGWYYE
ncbi:MAG: hypothetical protein JWR89_3919 [Tardiphaga sp.]|jgi:hypothetical protein|uniref:DUF3551 domain-containing protein n=1 Tax=Tardiphaga sp. TaxID=1926292 RepID=UPI00262AE560|nr:DUF3551 domain-containing protein [Tardiphaga sp.]MDB5504017.1 hypothetical protein [Tardiphaga sp.]